MNQLLNQCVDILLFNADIIPYSTHYVYGNAKNKTDLRAFLYKIHFLGDAANPPRYLPTRRDAASPWFIHLASHPKETHTPVATASRLAFGEGDMSRCVTPTRRDAASP